MVNMRFIVRNSPNYRGARQHIEGICEHYQITGYKFEEYIDDQISLWIVIHGKQYVLYLDYSTGELKINADGKTIRVFTKDVCWDNGIKFLHGILCNG